MGKPPDFEHSGLQLGVTLEGEHRFHHPEIQVIRRAEVVHNICEVVAAECNAAFGDRVVSLIITGSAARGEATIVSSGAGWKVLGDAEFLLVVRQTARATDDNGVDFIKGESSKKLRTEGIEVAIDLGLVSVSYLKKLPPHIFSYELRACGRVISGDPSIMEHIPKFTAGVISREDAWRLLCNRMIEQLEFVDDLERSPLELTPRIHYATVKLFLDMATSYLVFIGGYAPTYRDRAERLERLAAEPYNQAPFSLREFALRVAEGTSWKLTGAGEDRDRSVELWHEAIYYVRRLCHWEMMQLADSTDDFSDAELWAQVARQLTWWQKIRGWASVMKRSGGLKSWRNWPRWLKLGVRATPRYWIYRAGMEISFNLPALVAPSGNETTPNMDYSQLASILPTCKMEAGSGDNDWRLLASQIAGNYWKYLAETRA